jgi:nicotinate-nucleotide adenylyltransferase
VSRRVGIVGGTFDPIHLGHLAVAEAALRCAGLDEVLLIPAGTPPHRQAPVASASDRLEMARLAVEDMPRLSVSELEVERSGGSYTVDTLRRLREARPDADLYLVLGWDAARDFGSWREPGQVLDLARPVVIGRPGYPLPSPAELRAAGFDPDRVVLCAEPTPDIQATRIRRRAAAGEPLDGLVKPRVARYIVERGLYRGPERDNRDIGN